MIALIVISFVVSAFAVLVFMRRARRHARRYAADMPQRFHKGHVPRLGGAGIFIGTGAAWLATVTTVGAQAAVVVVTTRRRNGRRTAATCRRTTTRFTCLT